MDRSKVAIGCLMLRPFLNQLTELETKIASKLDMTKEELCEMDMQTCAKALESAIYAAESIGCKFNRDDIWKAITGHLDEFKKTHDGPEPDKENESEDEEEFDPMKALLELISNL